MMDKVNISDIFYCLEIYVSENKTGKFPLAIRTKLTNEQQFLNRINQNIDRVSQLVRITKNKCLTKILENMQYTTVFETKADRLWNFTLLGLSFLKAINEAILAKEQSCSGAPNTPELLSSSQEKIVEKCVQMVVDMGILPNLIPNVRDILKAKTNSTFNFENLNLDSSMQQKYCKLLTTMTILLDCMNQSSLQSVIVNNHSCSLLAALFALCYAPIKKIHSTMDPEHCVEYKDEFGGYEKYENLHWFISKLKVCNQCSDEDFIKEMWQDRKYFELRLQKFMKLMTPELLFWQLLFLQGVSFGTKCETKQSLKAPMWLLKACNRFFTTKILEPSGLKTFVQVVFEPVTDNKEVLSIEKIAAIAKVISHNPAKHISLDVYMQEITKQIQIFLSSEDTEYSQVLTSVASCIVLQFAERDLELCESVVSKCLFQPFWQCLQCDQNVSADGCVIATEEQITICIEHACKIFMNFKLVLTDAPLSLLLTFYHLLFSMFVKLLNSVSFLKQKVEGLVLFILNQHVPQESLKLLQLAAFEDVTIPKVQFANHLKIEFGDTGGVQVIYDAHPSKEPEENIEAKCQALTHLLDKVSSKKVKTLFFLSLIRKSIGMEPKDDQDYILKDEAGQFVDMLIAVHLLENLSEIIGEDLIENVEEAVTLIKAALECVDMKAFTDETVMTFLLILNTLIGYKEQLTSPQWNILKTCVPPLQNLMKNSENPVLKSLSENVCTTILTRGAVPTTVKDQSSSDKLQNDKQQQQQSMKFVEEMVNLVMTDCKNVDKETQDESLSRFEKAMMDSKSTSVPVQGHGLISLAKLIESRDEETLRHESDVLKVLQKSLEDEDSYVYLPAIRGLSALGDINTESVLPILLSKFIKADNWSFTLKIGEALLRICRNLNEMTFQFRDQLLNTFLYGVRHEDAQIRVSSLSNLGEVCKALKFSLGSLLQELLLCVISIVKTDTDIEVRRAAIMVIVLLLRGTGKDTFAILGSELKDLRNVLKWIFNNEKDDTLKLHAEEGLAELDIIVRESLLKKTPLIKEIHILDPS